MPVEDKLRILTAVKKGWGSHVTTVFVRQGHYAVAPKILADHRFWPTIRPRTSAWIRLANCYNTTQVQGPKPAEVLHRGKTPFDSEVKAFLRVL